MQMVENWKLVVLQRYTKFEGRAGRAEFWWFHLASFIILAALGILAAIASIFWIPYVLYGLAVIVPSVAVGIRRLHDTGKTGWFLLIGLIPFVGGIILIVFFALQGDPNPNEYGVTDPAAT